MRQIINVTRMHFVKKMVAVGVPLIILGLVALVSVVLVLIFQRLGADPSSADYVQGARSNMGMIWSLPGFLIYFGVQAVATTFPFALALGISRRAYVAGTALAGVVQALFLSLVCGAMLLLELATDHWFFGLYVFDIWALGAGNVWQLMVTIFVIVLMSMAIGGVFGAIWVRYGSKGPAVLGVSLALVLLLVVLAIAPQLGEIFAKITWPMLTGAGLAVALIAYLGTWWAMRRASVR